MLLRTVGVGVAGSPEGRKGHAGGLADGAQTLCSRSKARLGAQQREPAQKWKGKKKIRFQAVLLVNLKIKQQN